MTHGHKDERVRERYIRNRGTHDRQNLGPLDVLSTTLADNMGAPGGLNVEIVRWDRLAELLISALERNGFNIVRRRR